MQGEYTKYLKCGKGEPMPEVPIRGGKINTEDYRCIEGEGIFTIALAEYMKAIKVPFRIIVIDDLHEGRRYLMQTGLVVESGGRRYFIDSRGITTDEDKFLDFVNEYSEAYDEGSINTTCYDSIHWAKVHIHKSAYTFDKFDKFYNNDAMCEASILIRACKEYYMPPEIWDLA